MMSVIFYYTATFLSMFLVFSAVECLGDQRSAKSHSISSSNTDSVNIPCEKIEEKEKVSIWELSKLEIEDSPCKFGVEASVFAIGDPVHETLTLRALQNVGLVGESKEFVRGVFWNDDPCYQLFWDKHGSSLRPSFGLGWYRDFRKAEGLSKKKSVGYKDYKENLSCELLGRSHFGDLQFLHGMAIGNGIKAETTFKKILAWAEFTYRVSIGEIHRKTKLKSISGLAFLRSIPGEMVSKSASQIFYTRSALATQQRAIASLLHMIQDSYALGHVERDPLGKGKIKQFYAYSGQDHSRHADDDIWRSGETELDKIKNSPGAWSALLVSTEILNRYKAKESWEEVRNYLVTGPYALDISSTASGPGKRYLMAD